MSVSPSSHSPILGKTLKGAVAGFIASAPMAAVMITGWRFLPGRQRYLLPPQEITEELSDRLKLEDDLSAPVRDVTTLFLHFSYGAMNGAGYPALERRLPLPASMKGILYGVGVWAGSYLGWIPALRILRSAVHHPLRRNLLMILAHIVWGVTLGMIYKRLNSEDS